MLTMNGTTKICLSALFQYKQLPLLSWFLSNNVLMQNFPRYPFRPCYYDYQSGKAYQSFGDQVLDLKWWFCHGQLSLFQWLKYFCLHCNFACFSANEVKGQQVASGNRASYLWQQQMLNVKTWPPIFRQTLLNWKS